MKASAALLAGLLAGLTLGGVSQAQPKSRPIVIITPDEKDDAPPAENPMKGTNPKAARCAMGCQAPTFQCSKRCGRDTDNAVCMEKCHQKHLACVEKCGVDSRKLKNPK